MSTQRKILIDNSNGSITWLGVKKIGYSWKWVGDGSTAAGLNFGNCNSSECQVNVYIDGKKIATANRNTHQKRAKFNFKNGSKLRITEGEGGQTSCMMMFNELKVISCRKCLPGIINSTKHRNILFNYCNSFNIMHVFYFIS